MTCPFCDFGAIVENENDKEFRCQNKECQIISCRLCRLESHIPLSCEEFRKENKLSAKHAVEEAMSDALIQKCNKCSKPFVKLYGCNKMTCPCGNLQCYVCGKSIQDYRHFERPEGPNGTKCPLHEKDDSRLEKKLRDAQDQAVKKVLEETSDVEEEDVRVPLNPVHMTVPPNPQNIPHVNFPVHPFLFLISGGSVTRRRLSYSNTPSPAISCTECYGFSPSAPTSRCGSESPCAATLRPTSSASAWAAESTSSRST